MQLSLMALNYQLLRYLSSSVSLPDTDHSVGALLEQYVGTNDHAKDVDYAKDVGNIQFVGFRVCVPSTMRQYA
jgi:hypothetical protein